MQYAPTAYRQEAFFLMVDWWGSKNVTGQTSPAAAAALLLMEKKKAKEDQGDDRHQVGRIGAEDCLGLHFIRLVSVGGSLGLSRGLRPRATTSFSSLDGRKGSKRRSRR